MWAKPGGDVETGTLDEEVVSSPLVMYEATYIITDRGDISEVRHCCEWRCFNVVEVCGKLTENALETHWESTGRVCDAYEEKAGKTGGTKRNSSEVKKQE